MGICALYDLHHPLYEQYETMAAGCYDPAFFSNERLESLMAGAGFGIAQQDQYRAFWHSMTPQLKEFLWLYYYIQYNAPVTFYRNIWQIETLPLPAAVTKAYPGMIPVTVYLAAADHLKTFAESHGFDPGETLAAYFDRFRALTENNRVNYGHYGLVRLGAFLYAYSRMYAVVIGRLAYQLRVQENFCYVYETTDGSRLFVASAVGTYDENGLQAPVGWTPVYEQTGKTLKAHIFAADGHLEQEPSVLDTGRLRLLLAPGDDVVTVHIPASGKLTAPAVDDSLRQAKERLPALFPDAKATVCTTWFIDPHIRPCLKEGSNLLAFARRFDCISGRENNYHSLYEHIFGVSRDTPMTQLRPLNAFQQTMLDWCLADKKLYWGFGVLRDDPLRRR